jgi:hypothetical protein
MRVVDASRKAKGRAIMLSGAVTFWQVPGSHGNRTAAGAGARGKGISYKGGRGMERSPLADIKTAGCGKIWVAPQTRRDPTGPGQMPGFACAHTLRNCLPRPFRVLTGAWLFLPWNEHEKKA